MRLYRYVLVALALVLALGALPAQADDGVERITAAELKSKLGSVMIIDVRRGKDWTTSKTMIKGAVRQVPADVAAWAKTLPKDREIVLYCD